MVSHRTLILECGDNRVALGVFGRAGQRLRLYQFAVEPFVGPADAGNVSTEIWIKNVGDGLRALARRTGAKGAATLVLPAHLTLTKAIRIPRVESAKREKIINFEAGENIPYALSDVVWDSVVVSETSTEQEVLLATAKLEVLDPLCAAAHSAGFQPRLILPGAFATLAGLKLIQNDHGKGFLGLNLGTRSTTLVLFEAGRFAVRTFALGSEAAGERPAAATRARIEKDESIRTRLLQEITRSLLHFQWRSGMNKPNTVCLSGLGADLSGLVEAMHAKLKVPVHVFDPFRVIEVAEGCAASDVAKYTMTLVDLMGAASVQLHPNQPKVNLLPPGALERVNYRTQRPWLVAAALLATCVLIPPLIHFRRVRDEAKRKSTAIEHELAPLRARDQRIHENLKRVDELKQRLVVLEDVRARRTNWLVLMASLQDRLAQVEDVWLEKLQLAPVIAGAPLKLLVSGRMLDRAHPLSKVSQETFQRVKNLLARLGDTPFVASVESERFENQQPGVLKFDFVLVTDAKRPL